MNPTPHRADALHQPSPELSAAPDTHAESGFEEFDPSTWAEPASEPVAHGAGGRAVLGSGLILLALLWMGYTAWSAGRALAGEPLSSPAIAQWVAIAAGPLALLGLAWIMFGRTRRREAERFTRSVIAMRHEAQALEALLGVLSTRITDSNGELSAMATQLMSLGDEATGRMGAASRELGTSTELMVRHGEAFDRAAESARTDIGVLLEDLPRAEATARAMAEQLRGTGAESLSRAAALEAQVGTLTERTREADEMVASAAQRLVTHLTHIESAGAAAAVRVGEAEAGFTVAIDTLLDRTARMLDEVRSGIDAQSAAVLALVEQSSVGLGRAGIEAADALGASVSGANGALDGLSARVAEQERAAQQMLAEIDRGLALIDTRFAELARNGDERAEHFLGSLTRARSELDLLAQQAGSQDGALEGLASRTDALRAGIERLSADINEGLSAAIGQSEAGAERLVALTGQARPEIEWMRDASGEAATRLADSAAGIAEQQDRFAALLATLDDGVGNAESRLAQLTAALGQAQGEAARLTAETAPTLVAAMVQVREAASHAAERAREALAGVVPEAAANLSESARTALESVIRESIEERLREVETTAASGTTPASASRARSAA
ncbi:hypothetical protein, partial [Sphingomonas sp.]|uniref:hypothetical protein n=1 Tax=Sphingomonas sp. TaxID=28214 RepID=UPI00286E4E1D